MDAAEQFASDYLTNLSLKPERFSKEETRQGKTPDFRVLKRTELVAYCEAKHVQHDTWLDDQLKMTQPLEIVGGPRPDPIPNRLTSHIHRAAQQFVAVNPNHDCPNVLVFVNSDRSCTFDGDLRGVLTGNFYAADGTLHPIFENFSNGRIREEKLTIDLFVWRDHWKNTQQLVRRFFWKDAKHRDRVYELFGPPSRRTIT